MSRPSDRLPAGDDHPAGAAGAAGDGAPPAADEPTEARLRRFLLERGATEAEIDRAELEGWLPLLALDRVVMPDRAIYDADEVAERAGTDRDTATRVWRSLGFPDVPDGVPAFGDESVEALHLALSRFDPARHPLRLVERPGDQEWLLLRQTRVFGSALARVASVEADAAAELLAGLRAVGLDDATIALLLVDEFDWRTITVLVDYVHRLQLRAALWRRLARSQDSTMTDLAIGFADLTGYTALSERLPARDLEELLARWDDVGYDTVAEHGARVVKTIGDEIMFVGLPDAVARAALELAARAEADETLQGLRVGVACGPVLARDGDFYGPVVNLAHRLTSIAPEGRVLAGPGVHRALERASDLRWASLGSRFVRDIGEVEVWQVAAV